MVCLDVHHLNHCCPWPSLLDGQRMTSSLSWPCGATPHRDRGKFSVPTYWKLDRCLQGSGACASGRWDVLPGFEPCINAGLAWCDCRHLPEAVCNLHCTPHVCVIRPLSSFQPLVFHLLTGIPCAINLPLISECGKAGSGILFMVGVPGACTWHMMAIGRSCPWALSRGKPLGGGLGRAHLEFPCLVLST